MAVLGTGLDLPNFSAGQDIEQYVFAKIQNGVVVLPKSGDYCDGVTLEQYNTSQSVLLRYVGTAKVKCGTDIPDSSFLSTNESGYAVPAIDGKMIVAKALEQGKSGQIIQVILLAYPNVKLSISK